LPASTKSSPSMRSCGGNLTFIDDGHAAILGAVRRAGPGEGSSFLLFASLDIHRAQHLEVDLPRHGLMTPFNVVELLHGQTLTVEGQRLYIDLDPCGVKVFQIVG
jgi:hypothetical protein